MQPDSEESEKDNWLAELLNQHGMPNFIMRVNNQDHIADVVAANIGIIIVSKRIIQSLPKSMFNDIAAIPLRPAIAIYGNYVLNNNVPPSPLLQAYLPYLLKKVSTKI